MMKRTILSSLVIGLLPASAWAHVGHEAALVRGEAHWVSQPDHAIVVAGVAVLAAGVAGMVKATFARRKRIARE